MKHIHFYSSQMGDAYSIQKLLQNTRKYKITVHDPRTGLTSGSGKGADLVFTSHLTPGGYPLDKVIHTGHGFGIIPHLGSAQELKQKQKYRLSYGNYFSELFSKIGYNDTIVFGMPMSIDLLEPVIAKERNAFLLSKHLDPNKKTILYSPTWGQGDPRGFFIEWWEDGNEETRVEHFCKVITENSANLIVRLHEKHRYSQDWLHIYRHIFNKYNVTAIYLDQDRYSLPYYKYSDILIGDLSGTNSYFYVMDKPVIHIGKNPSTSKCRLSSIGWHLDDRAGPVVNDFDELLAEIKKALSGYDVYQRQRKLVVSKCIDYVGQACKTRTLAIVENVLQGNTMEFTL